MKLYEKLQKRAAELNIKQVDLCKALNIPKSTLNGYFRGAREPDIETLKLLAQELNTTTDSLLSEENEPITALLDTITPMEFFIQQGITNPDHLASLLNLVDLMKADAEADRAIRGDYIKKESSSKQAN